MRYVLASFLFFLASLPVVAQTTYPLIEGPPPAKLAEASAMVDAVKKSQSPVALSVGGYALIQIKVTTKLTPYVVPGSNDCLATESIPKGKVYRGWFVPLGGKEFVYTTIAADPDFDRLLVTGTIKGTATILWLTVANGEAVVVAGYQFDVAGGKPKPPGPDPSPDLNDFEKKLKSAGDADIKAGKGSKEHALLLASVYKSAANALPQSTTIGELYKTLQTAFTAAGVPPVAQSLPTMRQAIATELDKRLPTETDKQVTLEDKNKIVAAFNMIAESLEAVFQ